MVISSKLPARGYRVDGKAAETVRLMIGLRFRWTRPYAAKAEPKAEWGLQIGFIWVKSR
jgi:hypothetical protein